jgi:hypothetical protein
MELIVTLRFAMKAQIHPFLRIFLLQIYSHRYSLLTFHTSMLTSWTLTPHTYKYSIIHTFNSYFQFQPINLWSARYCNLNLFIIIFLWVCLFSLHCLFPVKSTKIEEHSSPSHLGSTVLKHNCGVCPVSQTTLSMATY